MEAYLKTSHQLRIEGFMRKAKQGLPEFPTEPDSSTRILRAKLILEESLETIWKGLGVKVYRQLDEHESIEIKEEGLQFAVSSDLGFDLIETIDGCMDISVVTTGTLSACGVPDQPFLELVDKNNLAKFGPGHSYREDGKLIKPPGHKPPDIQGLLESLYQPLVEAGTMLVGNKRVPVGINQDGFWEPICPEDKAKLLEQQTKEVEASGVITGNLNAGLPVKSPAAREMCYHKIKEMKPHGILECINCGEVFTQEEVGVVDSSTVPPGAKYVGGPVPNNWDKDPYTQTDQGWAEPNVEKEKFIPKIGSGGLCDCDCGSDCPLDKTGTELRCSRDDLQKAGVTFKEYVPCPPPKTELKTLDPKTLTDLGITADKGYTESQELLKYYANHSGISESDIDCCCDWQEVAQLIQIGPKPKKAKTEKLVVVKKQLGHSYTRYCSHCKIQPIHKSNSLGICTDCFVKHGEPHEDK